MTTFSSRLLIRMLEAAKINVTKPYKPRRLELDPVHRMARQLHKLRMRNPQEKRKAKLRRVKYVRKNRQALEKRSEFVKKAKDRMPKPFDPTKHRESK